MFRALSTRKGRRNYEQLHDEPPVSEPKLSRSNSLPARILSSSKKMIRNYNPAATSKDPTEKEVIKKASKVHPFFSLFETKRKKKTTADPQFSRYVEYVKEGGGTFGI